MGVLVMGSSGHLGEAVVRVLEPDADLDLIGLDLKPSSCTTALGSIAVEACVAECMAGVDIVFHTATLHKPRVPTHTNQAFVDANVSGTLALLEAAVANGVSNFVLTSTTSVFGDAMRPSAGEPTVWVTEGSKPLPKNIYGVTKAAAEELYHLFHRKHGSNCIVLRTSRFFPEQDDDRSKRERFTDANTKANEFLCRRVELEGVDGAHVKAAQRAADLGFGRYIVNATTPFLPEDMPQLNSNAADLVRRCVPEFHGAYESLGWAMFNRIDSVYVNKAARVDPGREHGFDFKRVSFRPAFSPASAVLHVE